MKKLFSLFLALSLLFLTACNIAPSTGTTASGPQDGGTTESQAPGSSGTEKEPWNWQDELQDQIVIATYSSEMIDIPSRIIFESYLDDRDGEHTLYFSKADEKAYIYCFDPLCNHTDMTCLAKPNDGTFQSLGWNLGNSFLYENRFYCVTHHGQIASFSFDGTDKRIDYDMEYEFPPHQQYTVWYPAGRYGPYLYIDLNMDLSGAERHLLRYNLDTKEMEDLTEKTGNYISPSYFYNGKIYGQGMASKTGDTQFVADLDLNTIEVNENFVYQEYCSGNLIVGYTYVNNNSTMQSGIDIFNIETGEHTTISHKELGTGDYVIVATVTDEHIYFYEGKGVFLGKITQIVNGKEKEIAVSKRNNGKLYRMDLDGTNIVCVYDNPDYELNRNTVIYGDRVVIQGQYVKLENGEKKVWGGPLQVAVINEDGTFGEFREVEFVG